MTLDLLPYQKINSKYITDLTVKHKTRKPLEENIRENLHGLEYDNDFFR